MKKVVIGITGSIAIYKTCEIISRLKRKIMILKSS